MALWSKVAFTGSGVVLLSVTTSHIILSKALRIIARRQVILWQEDGDMVGRAISGDMIPQYTWEPKPNLAGKATCLGPTDTGWPMTIIIVKITTVATIFNAAVSNLWSLVVQLGREGEGNWAVWEAGWRVHTHLCSSIYLRARLCGLVLNSHGPIAVA